ncbi:MAG: ABC transporter ATP-binding protein [Eubacteriales bacterium]|nr:ABC transporter ATP-binding protein [Christensenellaceae bacterium]MDY3241991.1 ABC transporter ATP-binding protein [Eubacteriales bacterium]
MAGKQMTRANKGTFGRLLKYLWKYYKWQVLVMMATLLFSSFAMIIANVFLQKIIDNCITPGLSEGWNAVLPELARLGGTMIIIFCFGILSSYLNNQLNAVITQGMLYRFRKNMFENMETLPIKYFDTHQHGTIMSTYTNDTDAVRQLIGQSLPTLFQSAFTLLAIFIFMAYYSIYLTLLVIGVIVIMLLVVMRVGGASGKYMVRQQAAIANEEGYVEEMINGQKVVKVFNHEDEAKEGFDKLNEQLNHDGYKAHKYGNILMPILGNMGNIMYVLLAFVGGILILAGVKNVGITGFLPLTPGIIVAYLSLSRQLSNNIGQMSAQISMVTMGLAGASRVFELIDEQPEKDEGYVMLVNAKKDENGNITECEERTGLWAWKHFHKDDGTTTYVELKGDIELDDVDFGYVPEKAVLHNVSLRALPGQKFAFVGATGAGKTTITNLINRFYDIQDGKIRYDGININKINKKDLRRSLGVVLQDTNLFTGTVMDNIRYGRLDATDDDCIRAAKLANADDFITRLPEGYQTVITGNGANLSQGQRQLLSIARAAVADPPVMILDEATSSIDTRTEALVQAGMDNLMKGRTVFVIAHRLSTIRNADSVIVLDHGRIIERGTHDQLIARKGTYYQLYTGATELE